jgi:hypothetical protein
MKPKKRRYRFSSRFTVSIHRFVGWLTALLVSDIPAGDGKLVNLFFGVMSIICARYDVDNSGAIDKSEMLRGGAL